MGNHMLLIKGGTVIRESGWGKEDILILGDRVEAIGSPGFFNFLEPDEILDASEKLVLPGLVDPHVHFHVKVPAFQTAVAHDFFAGSLAAAHGGVTTFIDFSTQEFSMNQEGQSLLENLLERDSEAEKQVLIDWSMHGMLLPQRPEIFDEIPKLIEDGIPSFKCFTTSELNRLVDDETILQILESMKVNNGMLMVHCENDTIIEHNLKRLVAEEQWDWINHARSRPRDAENEAIRRIITLVEQVPASVYIVHVSTIEGVQLVQDARERGLPIHCETCTHYLTLTEDEYYKSNGDFFICNPPLRTRVDLEPLWQAIADGRIEVVSSDDVTIPSNDKKRIGQGRFDKVLGGIPGVEPRLSILFTEGVLKGRISLSKLVEITSTNPARIFGLYPKKGSLGPGADADIVLFNPEAEWVMSAENLHANTDFCPFEGWEVKGRVESVLSRGEYVIKEGILVGKPGRGRRIHRQLSPNTPFWG